MTPSNHKTCMALAAFALLACSQQQTTETQADGGAPRIEFEKHVFDFGHLKQGDRAGARFKFKNTGNAPLTITGIDTGCGCTEAVFAKTPVGPGETGNIELIFDTGGLHGLQTKTATVQTNAEPAELTIIATIE